MGEDVWLATAPKWAVDEHSWDSAEMLEEQKKNSNHLISFASRMNKMTRNMSNWLGIEPPVRWMFFT